MVTELSTRLSVFALLTFFCIMLGSAVAECLLVNQVGSQITINYTGIVFIVLVLVVVIVIVFGSITISLVQVIHTWLVFVFVYLVPGIGQ